MRYTVWSMTPWENLRSCLLYNFPDYSVYEFLGWLSYYLCILFISGFTWCNFMLSVCFCYDQSLWNLCKKVKHSPFPYALNSHSTSKLINFEMYTLAINRWCCLFSCSQFFCWISIGIQERNFWINEILWCFVSGAVSCLIFFVKLAKWLQRHIKQDHYICSYYSKSSY